ncbi:triose-phosphate isomerase [Silvimonas soli]|uniref:triose-phosphate isomerase n=1 Tax=Silvimonas soli TaxID=2980100 RepID=UPI0024B37A7F|nr:triose-phosphate isomerase [Silvimonas soli]
MQPLIAGNWKMNGLTAQLDCIETIAAAVRTAPPAAEVLLCLPATLISRGVRAAAGQFRIGGQNCASEVSGPFTGDISAQMLRDAGATAVIVGHSERRQLYDETDVMVAAKAEAAWQAGLVTIICVGETSEQRLEGQTLAVCAAQIDGSVPTGMAASANVVAYEPRWAIGTGRIPTLQEIAQVHAHIRLCLIARLGPAGKTVPILYGGSVTAADAHKILAVPEVGGALVGGASLNAAEFETIFRAAPAST